MMTAVKGATSAEVASARRNVDARKSAGRDQPSRPAKAFTPPLRAPGTIKWASCSDNMLGTTLPMLDESIGFVVIVLPLLRSHLSSDFSIVNVEPNNRGQDKNYEERESAPTNYVFH